MALTQESVLSALTAEGGRLRKSDLVARFKGLIDCQDPAETQRNRQLFKTLVNNVAVVREVDGVRYVVVKKAYQRVAGGDQTGTERGEEEEDTAGTGEREPGVSASPGDTGSAGSEPDPEQVGESGDEPTELASVIQQALRRSQRTEFRVKRMLNVEVLRQEGGGGGRTVRGEVTESRQSQSKPYALPLRMPPTTRVEIRQLKGDQDQDQDQDEPTWSPKPDSGKRRPPAAEERTGSPQLRRAVKSTKASEEHKDTRVPSAVPLEQTEHEWLVRCAAGHWSQVYGLLLRDNQLADKRDFMSGFTALHWAAKCGNSDMLVKIIDLSRQGGTGVDVNARTHGGYTPLHIAALHDQEYIMAMLVGEYGVDVSVRDNCGKRAYHYLHKGVSKTLREMMGVPAAPQAQDRALQEREEPELVPDLAKGRHSISRLFQPHVPGNKKKHKQRPGFLSLSEDPGEDRQDGVSRQRLVSDVFM